VGVDRVFRRHWWELRRREFVAAGLGRASSRDSAGLAGRWSRQPALSEQRRRAA